MATRLYLPNTNVATPISPPPRVQWKGYPSGAIARTLTANVPQSDILTNISHTGGDSLGGNTTVILYKQYISPPLAVQSIPGVQSWKLQCQIQDIANAGEHYLALAARTVAADGVTERKQLVTWRADNLDAPNSGLLTNRSMTGTTSAGDYTVIAGERLVIELGIYSVYPSQPFAIPQHGLRLGYNASGYLPEDDSSISTTLSPWFELSNDLLFAYSMPASSRSYSLAGQPATLRHNKLAADVRTFGLSGKPANLLRNTRLVAGAGAFTLGGQDANLSPTKRMAAELGQYTLSGQPATFQKQSLINAGVGTFILNGRDATLEQRGVFMNAEAGAFILNGQNANLTTGIASRATGSLAWLLINKAKRGNF